MIKVNYNKAVSNEALFAKKDAVLKAYQTLVNKTGAGNDFLGWLRYPEEHDLEEYARIKKAAKKIADESDILVVVGIGGSYLGAKAVIEALKPYYSNNKGLEVIFAGHTLSSTYMSQLLEYLQDRNFSVQFFSVLFPEK